MEALTTGCAVSHQQEDDDDDDSPMAVTITAVNTAMEAEGIAAVARPGSSAVELPTTESAVGGDGLRKRRRGSDDEGAEEHSTAPIAGVPEAVVPPVKKKRKRGKYRAKQLGRTNHRTRTKEARNLNNLH